MPDNNTTEGIATNLGWNVPNKFMTKCCSYFGVNESVHFNNVWEMSVQISLSQIWTDIFSTLLKRTTLYYRSYIVYTCIAIVGRWQT
jgi:hypothetical protein